MEQRYERLTNNVYGTTWVENLRAYQIDTTSDGSVIYMRFHPGDINGNSFIIRVVETAGDEDNTLTTVTCTVGVWANRRILAESVWEPINGSKSLNPALDGRLP